MKIETRPITRPQRHFDRGRSIETTRQRQRHAHGGSVVRVSLSVYRSKLYAYRCDGQAKVGDMVEVDTPLKGVMVVEVKALGRGGYMGPLKPCKLVT